MVQVNLRLFDFELRVLEMVLAEKFPFFLQRFDAIDALKGL